MDFHKENNQQQRLHLHLLCKIVMPKSSSFISHLNFAEPTFNSPIFAQSQTDKTWLFVLKQKLELGIIPTAVLKKLLSMIRPRYFISLVIEQSDLEESRDGKLKITSTNLCRRLRRSSILSKYCVNFLYWRSGSGQHVCFYCKMNA